MTEGLTATTTDDSPPRAGPEAESASGPSPRLGRTARRPGAAARSLPRWHDPRPGRDWSSRSSIG
jgi:hypothetical protein